MCKELNQYIFCDGTLSDREVWVNLPKNILTREITNILQFGRGGMIILKKALVTNGRNLQCDMATAVEIMR